MAIVKSESGFTAVEILGVIVLVGVIGVVALLSVRHYLSYQATQSDVRVSPLITTPSPSASMLTAVNLNLDNTPGIMVDVPAGWTQDSKTGKISQSISGTPYTIAGQINNKDYLKLDTYTVSNTAIDEVTTRSGRTFYILEDQLRSNGENHLYLSDCAPQNNHGCSPRIGDMYAFVTLSQFVKGDTYFRGFPADAASNPQAIDEFEKIIETLRFK